ncbi:MAG: HAD-IA family hydrolase [Ignavibacteriae bacterium]|nr:HAD-IA family hydrolase [Ignavibacteriota bacterium]
MNKFKNIQCFVLDFGGVLYDISHLSTFQAFLSISNNKKKFDIYKMNDYLNDEFVIQFEKGIISKEEFRYKVKNKFSMIIDDKLFDEVFNATLVGLKSDAIQNVKRLKDFGKVFLLSNTNVIHYKYFIKECNELFDLFDGLLFSFLLGNRKPDTEIFNLLSIKTGFNPQCTLFIDDSPENIVAAKQLDYQTFLIDNTNNLSDLFNYV